MSGLIQVYDLVAIFPYVDDLTSAIRSLKKDDLEIRKVFSPAPNDEIEEALESKRDRVRFFTLFGGIIGCCIGFGLSIYTFSQWKLVVWGKPFLAWTPFTVIGYEFTVLGAVICTFLGVLVLSRRPHRSLSEYYDPRFTEDHFGIVVRCAESEKNKISAFLNQSGAKEIHEFLI